MFAWFVIDFLSMLILFDTFIDHRSLIAPMPVEDLCEDWLDYLDHTIKHFLFLVAVT